MTRLLTALMGGLLLLASGESRAADNLAAGTWKFTFVVNTQRGPLPITFLVMLSEGDKGWVGDFLGVSLRLDKEPRFDSLSVKEDRVAFAMKIDGTPLAFDGRMAKDGKKIRGSLDFAGQTFLLDLQPSKLKNLADKFAAAKDTIEQAEGGTEYFEAVFTVLSQATTKKMKVEDVRVFVDKASQLAETYGARWHRSVSMKIASSLVEQEAFVAVALEQARQAERMLKPDDDAAAQMQVLEALAATLKKAKKLDDLKPIESRLVKLEARDFADYAKKNPPFKPEEFKGRKGKSDRVVLVELFTGAECRPCVPVDLAFDGMEMTYKPTEVVFLQYHLHIPRPDPLTNKDSLEHAASYRVNSTPSLFFNGKKDASGVGKANASKLKYTTYREEIDQLLEKPSGGKLQLSASRKGNEIAIKAGVSDLEKPGEKVTLRFALTEERVRYTGGNGLRYHHCVVRSLPGGAKGVPLTKKASEHTATVDLSKLRADIGKYLEDFDKEDEFPNPDRPLALRNLRVVAFIQDDASGEVLQAAQVEVEEKKGE